MLTRRTSQLLATVLGLAATIANTVLPASAQSGTGALIEIKNKLEPIGRYAFNQPNLLEQGGINNIFIDRVAAVIAIFLGLLGIVFVILIIYAGYLWMTAQGNEEQAKEAQTTIRNAIIGVIVIGLSYALTAFVIGQLTVVTQ